MIPAGSIAPPEGSSAPAGFVLRDVGFRAGGAQLIAGVSLALPPGTVVGLIGHNGSGKSTLLKILARQQPASEGAVTLSGRPLSAWASRDFARRVAYLPQTTAAASGLTVRELAAFGRYPWHGPLGRIGTTDRDRVEAALVSCHVDGLAGRLVDTLSGGERQRAWIAMLVAQEADFILLDEPISALDLAQQVDVLGLLRDLSRRRGTGILAILHDVNMAARYCDEIVALKAGRVVARGTPPDLMREEVLESIFGVPMLVMPHPAGGTPIGLAR